MDAIQPAGGYSQAISAAQYSQSSQAAASAQSMTASVTTTSITMMNVSQQVGDMLSNINPQLANDQYLKLMIAILILNTLLSGDGGSQQSGQSALNALQMLGSGNSTYQLSIETSTNSIQLQQQSIRLDTVEAAQSAWQANGAAQGGSGRELDMAG